MTHPLTPTHTHQFQPTTYQPATTAPTAVAAYPLHPPPMHCSVLTSILSECPSRTDPTEHAFIHALPLSIHVHTHTSIPQPHRHPPPLPLSPSYQAPGYCCWGSQLPQSGTHCVECSAHGTLQWCAQTAEQQQHKHVSSGKWGFDQRVLTCCSFFYRATARAGWGRPHFIVRLFDV